MRYYFRSPGFSPYELPSSFSPISYLPTFWLHIRLMSRRSSFSGSNVVPFSSLISFHSSPKLIPWFVSDVTPPDFKQTVELLLDASFLSASSPSEAEKDNLQHMVTRWKDYVEKGVFSLPVPRETPLGGGTGSIADFWTTPLPYWDLKIHAPSLWQDLHENSSLVIFKVCVFSATINVLIPAVNSIG